jgi:hypothetical protein
MRINGDESARRRCRRARARARCRCGCGAARVCTYPTGTSCAARCPAGLQGTPARAPASARRRRRQRGRRAHANLYGGVLALQKPADAREGPRRARCAREAADLAARLLPTVPRRAHTVRATDAVTARLMERARRPIKSNQIKSKSNQIKSKSNQIKSNSRTKSPAPSWSRARAGSRCCRTVRRRQQLRHHVAQTHAHTITHARTHARTRHTRHTRTQARA